VPRSGRARARVRARSGASSGTGTGTGTAALGTGTDGPSHGTCVNLVEIQKDRVRAFAAEHAIEIVREFAGRGK